MQIITPDSTVFDGEVSSVSLPTSDGEITVLPHHVPIITTVSPGPVTVHTAEGEKVFAVSRGVIEIDATSVRVLSDIADRADELEEEAIERARAQAEKLMTEKREDATEFAEATALMERELGRLLTVRRYRARKSFGPRNLQ